VRLYQIDGNSNGISIKLKLISLMTV